MVMVTELIYYLAVLLDQEGSEVVDEFRQHDGMVMVMVK